jgi:hypothetical protein
MFLVHLPANNAWVFTFGDSMNRLDGFPLFFQTRKAAVNAAASLGLVVDARGQVE